MGKDEPVKVQSRDVPRDVTIPVVPNVVTLVIDHTVQSTDTFILTPSKGKPVTVKTAKAVSVDATHSKIEIAIKDVKDKGLTYTLTQRRGGPGGTVEQELFTRVPASLLLIDKEATRPKPEKQKQYFTLRTDPPPAEDSFLKALFPDYSLQTGKNVQKSGNERALSKDSKALQLTYDSAIAVMTRQCRFVEWRFYGGGDDYAQWSPFGLLTSRAGSWKEIKGPRWIYVYRRDYRTGDRARWVDELFLDLQGNIEAVPMAGVLDRNTGKVTDKPRNPVKLGRTISFARRIQGVAYEYFFFATRIQLPPKAIDKLGSLVEKFAPPVNFEDTDMNVADIQDGKALVAVLDPMTIALELHDAYIVALDNLTVYTSVHDKQSLAEQKAVRERQRKLLLAQLMDSLTSRKSDPDNTLHYELNDSDSKPEAGKPRLDAFLKEYEEQLQHRLKWRDYWTSFLRRWLDSPIIGFLQETYEMDLKNDWPDFLIFADSVHERLYESADGRAYIESVVLRHKHWVHEYVLPEADTFGDKFQVFRKAGGSILGLYREYAPAYLHKKSLTELLKVTKRLALSFESINVFVDFDVPLNGKFRGELRSVKKLAVTANLIRVSKVTEIERSRKFRERNADRVRISFSGAVEGVNIYLAFKAMEEAYKSGTGTDKVLAWLNLAGSMIDFTAAISEMIIPTPGPGVAMVARGAIRTVALVGFVSAVIDTILGLQSTVSAYRKGDMGGMIGSAVVTVGSAALAVLAFRAMLTGMMGGPWGLIAMMVVAIGYAIKALWGDKNDYQKLVGHCEWGKEAGKGDSKPDFTPVPLGKLKGNFEAQIIAALNLLCTIKLERIAQDLRVAKVQADWFPQGALLEVTYTRIDVASAPVVDTFVFADNGPISMKSTLAITANSSGGFDVKPPKLPARPAEPNEMVKIAETGKQWVIASAHLSVEYGEYKFRFPAKYEVAL